MYRTRVGCSVILQSILCESLVLLIRISMLLREAFLNHPRSGSLPVTFASTLNGREPKGVSPGWLADNFNGLKSASLGDTRNDSRPPSGVNAPAGRTPGDAFHPAAALLREDRRAAARLIIDDRATKGTVSEFALTFSAQPGHRISARPCVGACRCDDS